MGVPDISTATPASGDRPGVTITETTSYGTIARAEPGLDGASTLGHICRNIWLAAVLFSAHKPELVILLFSLSAMAVFGRYSGYVMVVAFLLYVPTYWKQPHILGHRRRRSWLSDTLIAWLGSYVDLSVVRESKEPFDPSQKYLFGYAPHAWIPMVGTIPVLTRFARLGMGL